MLLHLFPFETTDFFVDSSASPQLPFFSTQLVSKFGDVRVNNSFLSFVGYGALLLSLSPPPQQPGKMISRSNSFLSFEHCRHVNPIAGRLTMNSGHHTDGVT
jgi:hypothetical protein